MAQKRGGPRRGPGRPMNPGPTITPSAQINIPTELFESQVLKSVLSQESFEYFESLPSKTKEMYIDTYKKALFNATSEKAANGLINYGEDEFQDLAGVQVEISLNPADWKNPGEQAKKTLNNWAKGVLQWSDIERELEMKMLREIMSGNVDKQHMGTGYIVNNQILTSKTTHTLRGNPITLEGAIGIDGVSGYKDYAKSIEGWVEKSQSIGKRVGARAGVDEKLIELMEKELAHQGGTWVDAYGKPLFNDTQLYTAMESPGGIIASAGAINPNLERFLSTDSVAATYATKLDAEIVKGYTLGDMVQGVSGSRAIVKSKLQARKLLDSMGGKDVRYYQDFKNYVLTGNNWKTLGFSSAAAAREVLDFSIGVDKKDKRLGEWLSEGAFNPKVLPGTFSDAKSRDFLLAQQSFANLDDAVMKAKEVLVNDSLTLLKESRKDILDTLSAGIPIAQRGDFRRRLSRAIGLRDYVETRNTMLAQQEFLDAVLKGDLYKPYVFLGKWDLLAKYTPIQKELDKIKLPLRAFGASNLGELRNLVKTASVKTQDFIGLTGEGYTEFATHRFFTAFLSQQEYLYPGDFINGLNVAEIGGNKIGLFVGETYLQTKNKFTSFKNSFSSTDMGRVHISARQLDGLVNVLAALNTMSSNVPAVGGVVNISNFHDLFKGWYEQWELTKNADFIDALIAGGNLTGYTGDTAVLKKSFISIFKTLESLEKKGVDRDDFLSLTLLLGQKFIRDGKLVKYMAVLPWVATKLNAVQSTVFATLEHKLLYGVFKIKSFGIGKFTRRLWRYNKPGYGPVRQAKVFLRLWRMKYANKAFYKAIVSALGKLGSVFSKFLPAGLTGPQAVPALLALIIAKVGQAVIKSAMSLLKGDIKGVYYAFKNLVDDLIVNPTKFVVKILLYALAIILVFIIMILGGSVAQDDRDFGATAYMGSIFDDPTLACRGAANFAGSSASGLDANPVAPTETSCFGWRSFTQAGSTKYNFHTGIDYGATTGTPILSPYNGSATVISAGWNTSGYGNLVVLKANSADIYIYLAHMSQIDVTTGQTVIHRQQVGLVGSTGNSTGPHLHYEIRSGGTGSAFAVNPCSVFSCGTLCGGVSGSNLNGRGECYAEYEPYLP